MRLIKFRAWDESQKYMAYQGTPDLETLQSFMYHFGDKPLMQFTGHKDCDGKEIYEGDILEYVGTRSEGKRYKDLIEFDVECGGWYGKRTANTLSDILFEQHNDDWKKRQNYLINENQRVKIIGNIYENPELIKQ